MRGFLQTRYVINVYISLYPPPPVTGEPNNLSYDHEQAKQELL